MSLQKLPLSCINLKNTIPLFLSEPISPFFPSITVPFSPSENNDIIVILLYFWSLVNLTKCQQKRKEVKDLTSIDDTPVVGAYAPQCHADGTYKDTQCHSSTGYCWCVDKEGNELRGSRYRFETPECKRCKYNF